MGDNLRRKCLKCGLSPREDADIKLYRFPNPGPTNVLRCELWAKYCFPDMEWSSGDFQQKLYAEHRMLCSKHFEVSAFTSFHDKKLNRHAVPDFDLIENAIPSDIVGYSMTAGPSSSESTSGPSKILMNIMNVDKRNQRFEAAQNVVTFEEPAIISLPNQNSKLKEKTIRDEVKSNTPIRTVIMPTTLLCENVTQRPKPSTTAACDCLSTEVIRKIIREELDRKFETPIRDIQAKLANLDDSLTHFNTELDKVKNQSESQAAFIIQLQRDNDDLRASYTDLANRMNQAEDQTCTCNINIQCVPDNKNDVCNTVHQLANVKCPISDSNAKFNAKSPRPRFTLVKLSSRRLRDTFSAGVIKLSRNHPIDKFNTSLGSGGEKKSAVFVPEHLTLDTTRLNEEARRNAKELNYRFCWVRDGKIFLGKTKNSLNPG